MNALKIAAFRPENLIARSKEEAAKYNFDFFGFPVFQLVERREALGELRSAFDDSVDIVVFTSLNGVRKSFNIAEHGKFNLSEKLASVEVCAIGPVTRGELHRYGVHVSLMPEEYSTRGLMKLLAAHAEAGAKIIFLRSAASNKHIIEFLQANGAHVTDIAVYEPQIITSESERKLLIELINYQPDYIIFTSSLTFKMFLELASKFDVRDDVSALLRSAKIAAIGDLTAETIAESGIKVDIVAKKSTFEQLLRSIAKAIRYR